jgi:hypothetical protein
VSITCTLCRISHMSIICTVCRISHMSIICTVCRISHVSITCTLCRISHVSITCTLGRISHVSIICTLCRISQVSITYMLRRISHVTSHYGQSQYSCATPRLISSDISLFQAPVSSIELLPLGTFSIWRKATVGFVMSVFLSARNNSAPLDGFYEILYVRTLRQSVQKIQLSLKCDKNNGYFT